MDTRHQFRIAAIKERIEFYEAEHRRLLKLVSTSQVDLAWISERCDCVQLELRLLRRDLARAYLQAEDDA